LLHIDEKHFFPSAHKLPESIILERMDENNKAGGDDAADFLLLPQWFVQEQEMKGVRKHS
jgi:hypothetical protein